MNRSFIARLGVAAAAGAAALAVAVTPARAAWQAPESALAGADATTPACTTPAPAVSYSWLHCYTAQQIRAAYGVDQLPNKGDGQTIVLVTHDLPLCHEVADRIAILNRGTKVADIPAAGADRDHVVGWITGSRASMYAEQATA